jgi:membrane fusion protein (multidrug efflux system)
VAKQVLDHAVIALQNAKNEVQASEQVLKTAATNLTYSIIRAPFTGTIGFSQVKLGNLVSVGTTVLTTISTDDPMAVDFLVNESQLPHYEDLQRAKQRELDSLFTILMPGNRLYPHSGRISVIDRAVDPQTGTIRVRLEFPNPRHDLRAGMSCVLRVHNQEAGPQITIPSKAVVEQMGEYFVFIAKDSAAMQVKVEEGQTIGSDVIITKGIKDGDRIVVDGVQALHDGSPIKTANRP